MGGMGESEVFEGLSVVVEGLQEEVGGSTSEAVLEEKVVVGRVEEGPVEAALGEGLVCVLRVEARRLLVERVKEELGYLLRR